MIIIIISINISELDSSGLVRNLRSIAESHVLVARHIFEEVHHLYIEKKREQTLRIHPWRVRWL